MLNDTDRTVLVVDDERQVRDSIHKLLSHLGYEAVAVDGVPAAIDVMQRLGKKVSCIVSDYHMPGSSGLELINSIRRHPVSPPVILLTAYGDLELAVAAIRSGAFDFLLKPVNVEALRHSVERAVRFHALLRLEREFALELEESVLAMTHALRESEEKLSDLTEQLLTAEEQERHRMATELHDNIGQGLAFTKMKLMKVKTAAVDPDSEELLKQALVSLDAAIQSVRTLTTQISPPLLYEVGLEAALECLGDTLRAEHGLAVEVRCGSLPVEISEKERVTLFTCIRELLINVVKHSEISRAVVSVTCDEKGVVVDVSDNGVGFEDSAKTTGFGLFSIRQKMRHAGGSLTISSKSGRGTFARLLLPTEKLHTRGNSDDNKNISGG